MRDQIRAGSVPSLDNHSGSSGSAKVHDVDYMPKALITLFAYFVFFLAGFALNVYFLYDANKFRQTHGFKPDNVGCLWTMLIVSVVIPVATMMVGFALVTIFAFV